jgi:hypothetical protein
MTLMHYFAAWGAVFHALVAVAAVTWVFVHFMGRAQIQKDLMKERGSFEQKIAKGTKVGPRNF